MKKVSIGGKEYDIACNAFTQFEYKKVFKTGIFQDIQTLNEYSLKQQDIVKDLKKENPKIKEEEIQNILSNKMMGMIDNFIEVVLKIAWIEIHTADEKIPDFETWLKSMDKINISDSWITEVTELAVSSFC